MQKYYKLKNYREERLRLDSIFGYPSQNAETCITPEDTAIFYEGWYYIACEELIYEKINAVEISKEEYEAVIQLSYLTEEEL